MNRLMRNIFIEAFCVTISFAQIAPSTTFEQAEQSIAINPTNSDNIIVTTISIDRTVQEKYVSIFYTFNGGTNWVKQNPCQSKVGETLSLNLIRTVRPIFFSRFAAN